MRKLLQASSLKLPIAILTASLLLSGCFSNSDKKGSATAQPNPNWDKGAAFHGAEWASIKNLDPRKEECSDCHGKASNLSPNGGKGHNIGLANNTNHSALQNFKITGVKINEQTGEVRVTLNQPLPADAGNLSMTFAKLAPRVAHNRGHDWQNYFTSNALGRGGNEPASEWFASGGVAPQTVPNPQVNGRNITFNLGDGAGRSWGKHDFTVKSAYANDPETWEYSGVRGTKFSTAGWEVAKHLTCEAAAEEVNLGNAANPNIGAFPANQLAATQGGNAGKRPVCWWPDGTHLTSGVFVSDADEFIVSYDANQTHRVSIILGKAAGNPGFNAWYDFVPSVANGSKTLAQLEQEFTSNLTTSAADEVSLDIDLAKYINTDGSLIAAGYKTAEGNAAPAGINGPALTSLLHQALPAARDVVDIQSCNSCHDGYAMHGGSGRAQTQVCVTCHNPGNLQASSGRSVDFKQLIHRIHRGANLPSEDATVKQQMEENTGLVASTAGNYTKVRFPQGPTPGQAAGITNCVKCHMGAETQAMVQGLADELGADSFAVQEKMKLAKVTPQGDNWLSVRSVNACQACHDSNIWYAAGNMGFGGNGAGSVNIHRNPDAESDNPRDPTDANHQLDKYLPFYTDAYTGVGFKWLGKKLGRNAEAGAIHGTQVTGDNGRFTCGSSGGCHGNADISEITKAKGDEANQVAAVGNRTGNQVQQVHLELTRNFIIAERFELNVLDARVDATGFSLEAEILDKQTGRRITNVDSYSAGKLGSGLAFTANGMFGWLANGSPDYNHSAGGGFGANYTAATDASGGQPGAPAGLRGLTFDSQGLGRMQISWAEIEKVSGIKYDFARDFDKATSFGTVAINANLNLNGVNYRLRSANQDFSFKDGILPEGELARRQVVDFSAGTGIDETRDRYAGWDKHQGANTQSCSSCHLKLDMHGATASNNTQMCVVCHNPNVTDLRARAKDENGKVVLGDDGQYEESEDFKRLIHAVHAAGATPNIGGTKGFRIDPLQTRLAQRPSADATARGQSFPGVLSNCQSCHIEDEATGKWTFELDQLPEGMHGSSAITGDWAAVKFDPQGGQHNLEEHMKMSPIASVCSSCHDAGYKGGDSKARTNANILDGGPHVGSHWWVMGGIAPGIIPEGDKPSNTQHQSGK